MVPCLTFFFEGNKKMMWFNYLSVVVNELLPFLCSIECPSCEAYGAFSFDRNEEIVMPSERSGKIRENYDWKVRMFVVCLQSRITVRYLRLRTRLLFPCLHSFILTQGESPCKPETQSRVCNIFKKCHGFPE